MSTCDVSLVKQQSASACTRGHSFGCDNASVMWIHRGCRGVFDFDGTRLKCGAAGQVTGGRPRYCSRAQSLHSLASSRASGMDALARVLGEGRPAQFLTSEPPGCAGHEASRNDAWLWYTPWHGRSTAARSLPGPPTSR